MQREWTRFSLEVPTSGYLLMSVFTLLQLDANLIEGEPYNRLTYLKNKRQLKRRNKIQIYQKYRKVVFKAHQNEQGQWGPVRCHRRTDLFTPTHPPPVQKMSFINFKHKITTSANYADSIGTGYMSHDK